MKRPTRIKQMVILCSGLLVLTAGAVLVAMRPGGVESGSAGTSQAKAAPISLRTGTNPSSIPRERLLAMGLVPDQIRQVGVFAANGKRHEVYLGPTTGGTVCLIEDEELGTSPDGRPLRVYGKACSPDLLRDHAVVVSVSSVGGGSTPQSA